MAKSEESKTVESLQHLQNTEQKQPLVTENEAVEVVDDHKPQFTDISAFKRPNISGLRHSENVEIDNREMYEIERDLELPTINILIQPDMVNQVAEQATSGYELPNEESNVLQMPTIRLNTAIENEVDTIENSSSLEDLKIAESMLPQIQLDNDIEDTEEAIDDVREITPEFMVTPPKAMKDVSEQPAYPKGYGDTLIHPLLQRKVITEKPTTPLPTLDLLDKAPIQSQQITEQEIRETSVRLEAELANFGVKATVEDVLVGPVVTRYEIQPAAGVKASKITNLASDIARGLMFKAIRITEVIPNKPYMGIETPNKHRETVWLRDVLDSDEFRNTTATLPMALGKDISGEPVVVDMAKMPHLLVAGQTGGGKSVGVNTMILSLLFKLTPEQVRFIMIDPKVVELSIYNDIPHLLTPVVTDMKKPPTHYAGRWRKWNAVICW